MNFLPAVFRPLATLALLLGALLLSACSAPGPASPMQGAAAESTRLGTQWGEGVDSRVSTVQMKRAKPAPLTVAVLPYSAASPGSETLRELPLANGRVGLRVLKEGGSAWPMHRTGGTAQLQGKIGERYTLEYRNYSKTITYEIVATVDGLDVLTGQSGSVRSRGYVLRPGEVLRIEGFRKSRDEVAAFRFSAVTDSYAANSDDGSATNAGVIGTAVFELVPRPGEVTTDCAAGPCAFPDDRAQGQQGFASPPRYAN